MSVSVEVKRTVLLDEFEDEIEVLNSGETFTQEDMEKMVAGLFIPLGCSSHCHSGQRKSGCTC